MSHIYQPLMLMELLGRGFVRQQPARPPRRTWPPPDPGVRMVGKVHLQQHHPLREGHRRPGGRRAAEQRRGRHLLALNRQPCSRHWLNWLDRRQHACQGLLGLLQIMAPLHPQPEALAQSEETAQAQIGVGSDRRPPFDDCVDAALRYADRQRRQTLRISGAAMWSCLSG